MGIPIEPRLSTDALRKRALLTKPTLPALPPSPRSPLPNTSFVHSDDDSDNPFPFTLDLAGTSQVLHESAISAMRAYYAAYARRRPHHPRAGRLVIHRSSASSPASPLLISPEARAAIVRVARDSIRDLANGTQIPTPTQHHSLTPVSPRPRTLNLASQPSRHRPIADGLPPPSTAVESHNSSNPDQSTPAQRATLLEEARRPRSPRSPTHTTRHLPRHSQSTPPARHSFSWSPRSHPRRFSLETLNPRHDTTSLDSSHLTHIPTPASESHSTDRLRILEIAERVTTRAIAQAASERSTRDRARVAVVAGHVASHASARSMATVAALAALRQVEGETVASTASESREIAVRFVDDSDHERAPSWCIASFKIDDDMEGMDVLQILVHVLAQATMDQCPLERLIIKDDLLDEAAVAEGFDLLKVLSSELDPSYDRNDDYILHPFTVARIPIVAGQ